MKLTIEIDMDNAAFDSAPEQEASRILEQIGNEIIDGQTFGICRDVNDNITGKWDIDT